MESIEIQRMLQDGIKAYQAQDLSRAETIFKYIITQNPLEANALLFLGCIKRERGDLKVIEFAHKVTGERYIGKMFKKF